MPSAPSQPERNEAILKMWREGATPAQICAAIPGCTLGIVSGVKLRAKMSEGHVPDKSKRKATVERDRRIEPAFGKPIPATRTCVWVNGDPRGRAYDPHLFCGAPVMPGRSYCEKHFKLSIGK